MAKASLRSSSSRIPWWQTNWWPYGLLTLLTVGLRWPHLSGSFWLDEAAQVLESARPWSEQLKIAGDFQPPGLHILLHLVIGLNSSEVWLRSWGALLPGLVTVLGTYYLGQRLVSRSAGWLAALLLATSSFHIWYSQELRPYSWPAALAVLGWIMVVKLTSSPNSKLSWLWWGVVNCLGWFSSYLFPLAWLSQVLWLAWSTRSSWKTQWSWLGLASCAPGLLFLPWFPSFLEQLQVGGLLRESLPGWSAVVGTPLLKALPLLLGKLLFGVLDIQFSIWFMLATGAWVGLVTLLAWPRRWQWSQLRPFGLWLWWGGLPIVLAFLISIWIPVLQPKRLLFIWPAWYLWLAHLADSTWLSTQSWLGKHPPNFKTGLAGGLIGLLLLINAVGTGAYYTQPVLQRENWRGLVTQLAQDYPPNRTVVVFSFPAPFAPWEWYAQQTFPTLSVGTLATSADQHTNTSNLKKIIEYDYVVTFDYLRDLTDPNRIITQNLIEFGFAEKASYDYAQLGFVRVWARPTTVLSETR